MISRDWKSSYRVEKSHDKYQATLGPAPGEEVNAGPVLQKVWGLTVERHQFVKSKANEENINLWPLWPMCHVLTGQWIRSPRDTPVSKREIWVPSPWMRSPEPSSSGSKWTKLALISSCSKMPRNLPPQLPIDFWLGAPLLPLPHHPGRHSRWPSSGTTREKTHQ